MDTGMRHALALGLLDVEPLASPLVVTINSNGDRHDHP
jgi:hypothetical protein